MLEGPGFTPRRKIGNGQCHQAAPQVSKKRGKAAARNGRERIDHQNSLQNRAFCPILHYEGRALCPGRKPEISDESKHLIRLDSTTQRALLGFPVFGRRSITVHKAGTVSSVVKVAFGQDFEASTYPATLVGQAAEARKELRPGTTGPRYFR